MRKEGGRDGAVGVAVRWATRSRAMALTGVPESVLLRLVNQGYVRCRKTGAGKQARTVFNVPDIEEWWDLYADEVTRFEV